MSLEVRQLDSVESVNRNQWNQVVEAAELSCVFHRYGWIRAIERGLSREPAHLVVEKRGNPIAVFPNVRTKLGPVKQLKSVKPGYGGPVAMTDEAAALERLLDAVVDCCDRRTITNELRTYDPGFVRYHGLFRERGYDLDVRSCRFELDLTEGWESIHDGMDGERRRGIRRGHDNGARVVEEPITTSQLRAFHDDYVEVMERVGLPSLPVSFFEALADFEDRLVCFSLEVDGERHGSYLYVLDDEQSTLQHLFTAVTEADFAYRAPELLHEHAIRWGIDAGYDRYELRGSTPDLRDGVYRFKADFGAEPRPLLVWERGRPAPALSVLNAGRSVARKVRS